MYCANVVVDFSLSKTNANNLLLIVISIWIEFLISSNEPNIIKSSSSSSSALIDWHQRHFVWARRVYSSDIYDHYEKFKIRVKYDFTQKHVNLCHPLFLIFGCCFWFYFVFFTSRLLLILWQSLNIAFFTNFYWFFNLILYYWRSFILKALLRFHLRRIEWQRIGNDKEQAVGLPNS